MEYLTVYILAVLTSVSISFAIISRGKIRSQKKEIDDTDKMLVASYRKNEALNKDWSEMKSEANYRLKLLEENKQYIESVKQMSKDPQRLIGLVKSWMNVDGDGVKEQCETLRVLERSLADDLDKKDTKEWIDKVNDKMDASI